MGFPNSHLSTTQLFNRNLKKKKNVDLIEILASLTIVQNANHVFLQNFRFWMSTSINMIFSEFFDLFFFLLSCACMGGGGGYFFIRGSWGCAAEWGRIFTTGLTIMGSHIFGLFGVRQFFIFTVSKRTRRFVL